MTTSKVIGVLVAIALLLGLGFYGSKMVSFGTPTPSGPTHYSQESFLQGLTLGTRSQSYFDSLGAGFFGALATFNGGELYTNTLSTTTNGSETLQVSDIKGYDTVVLNPIVGSATITLFASSSATAWLPSVGNAQKTCFVNGTTTAGVNLTFAGGTGTLIEVASSSATALGSLVLRPQKMGCFTFVRANATATTFDILGAFTAFN